MESYPDDFQFHYDIDVDTTIKLVIMNDVELKVPSIVRYAMTDGFEHYGPKLSLLSRQGK
jgi:hypothetical protein